MTINELSVAVGADLSGFDKGLNAAVSKVESFGADVAKASAGAATAFNGVNVAAERAANGGLSSVDRAAGRFIDSTGRMRDANGRFVNSATLAAEAAGNFGGVTAKAGDGFAKYAAGLKKVSAAGEELKSAGQALSVGITLPLVAAGGAALASAAKIDSLRRGLEAVAETQLKNDGVPALEATARAATETTERLKELEEIARLPGLGFEDAVKGDLRLRNAGLSAEESAKSLREFGNAIARAGGGKEQLDRVTLALSQIATKGKVSQEEINQLTEAGIVLGPIMKQAFGTADTKQLEKAGIDATKFVAGITTELSKLPRVTGGIQNAFENARDALSKSAGRIGLRLDAAFNITGLVNRFADSISGLIDSFEALSPGAQKAIFGVAALAAATGPLLAGIGALGTAIPALVTGLGTVGASVGLAAGPVALIAVAVAGAAVAVVTYWDDIVAYFKGPAGNVFRELARAVEESIASIKAAFSGVSLGFVFDPLVNAGKFALEVLNQLATGIVSILDVVNGLVRTTTGLLDGDWARAWDGAKQVVLGLIAPIARLFGFDYADLRAKLNILGDAPQLTIGDLARQQLIALDEEMGRTAAQGGDLRAALGEVAATSVLTEDQLKALAALRKELADNERNAQALGSSYDFVGNRQSILSGGIEKLIEVGFKPLGRTVQGFRAQLLTLPEAIDTVAASVGGPLGQAFNKFFEDGIKRAQQFAQELYRPLQGMAVPALPAVLAPSFDTTPLTASVDKTISELTRLRDAQLTAEMFTEGMNQALVVGLQNVAVGFGEAIGQIISGSAGLEALPAAVLGAVGTMAVQLGQLAIGTGIAVAGIKKALETLNPAVAIAGGIALVALGTAVKGAAARIGSGGRSSSASLGGGGGSSPARVAPVRPEPLKVEVTVTGQLRGEGADLVAIISQDVYRQRRVN